MYNNLVINLATKANKASPIFTGNVGIGTNTPPGYKLEVNGSAKLVCKTRVKEIAPDGEVITIEPMGNFTVIKDLVTEMDSFWSGNICILGLEMDTFWHPKWIYF